VFVLSLIRGKSFIPALWAAILLSGCASQKASPPMGMPPVPVTLATAGTQAVLQEVQAIGNVEPSATVQVRPQVAGELMRANFTEGQNVKKGDLLFQIDPRPFREALRQAEAAAARDRALLKQAEANLSRDQAQQKNADTDAQRSQQLVKEGIIARSQYDTSRTNADVYAESVRADQAAIQSARASLDSDLAAIEKAKLDLNYCEIRAPITGRTGNLLVNVGNYVKANGDTSLVVINQIEPAFVSFGVPEQKLATIRRLSAAGKLSVRVTTKDAPDKPVTGKLSVVDNTVDATTGMIRLKATFANAGGVLWPGQFVNVTLGLDTLANAVVVASEAVQAGQKGPFVYVVKADKSVEVRLVTTGQLTDGKVVVESGLRAGETVVTDGQLLLAPGAKVMALPGVKSETGRQ
jgi:multidrug efflux system membrane fusion protein